MFKSFSATLWIVALLLNISSNDGHHDDLEGSYVVSTFVRLASRHSCSGKLENDVSKVPIDSIRILHDIKEELQNLGIEDVRLTDGMALVATIPASPGRESAPAIALAAHVDQSCAYPLKVVGIFSPGKRGIPGGPSAVKPLVHRNWDGRPITLPDSPDLVMTRESIPRLESAVNKTLITSSGKSPLGADGIAGAVSLLELARRYASPKRHPGAGKLPTRASFPSPEDKGSHRLGFGNTQPSDTRTNTVSSSLADNQTCQKDAEWEHLPEHGPIRLLFLPNGEVNGATASLRKEDVNAEAVYILDAETPGDIRYESPDVHQVNVMFSSYRLQASLGSGTSPEYPLAYNLSLCHMPLVTAEFLMALANSPLSCEKSQGRDPFIYVSNVKVGANNNGENIGSVDLVIYGFDVEGLTLAKSTIKEAAQTVARRPCVKFALHEHPSKFSNSWTTHQDSGLIRLARAAMRTAGLQPVSTPVRSQTDAWGISLEFGIPTMLLYSGWHAAHGPFEWTTEEEIIQVTDVIQELSELWLSQHVQQSWCPNDPKYEPQPGREHTDGPAF